MSFALRRARRAIRDPLKLARMRWLTLGWIVATSSLLLGAGFAFKGAHLLLSPGVFVLYSCLPGGLHTHGVIMSICGLALMVGLAAPAFGYPEPRTWLQGWLRITAAYYFWCVGLLILAPTMHGGLFSYVAVVLWLTVATLPAMLAFAPPPALVSTDETDLIRAAMRVGISPERASALTEVYFSGDDHEDR